MPRYVQVHSADFVASVSADKDTVRPKRAVARTSGFLLFNKPFHFRELQPSIQIIQEEYASTERSDHWSRSRRANRGL